MRLGQLARKLTLKPGEIIEFLTDHKIQTSNGYNTRLNDDQVALVVKHFGPGTEVLQAKETIDIPFIETFSEPPKQPITQEEALGLETVSDNTTVIRQPEEEDLYVIKAPKIELSGLKVVGKIDLPEPKKKDPSELEKDLPKDNHTAEILQPDSIQPKRHDKRIRPTRKPDEHTINPIALQREREVQEELTKRQAKATYEKEQRTLNYLKKVKVSAPKSSKFIQEPVEQLSDIADTPSRTLLSSFIKWLTT